MQKIILTGNDTGKMYSRLTVFIKEARKRGWEIVNDLIEETPSLFGTEKLIIIRNPKVIEKEKFSIISKIPGTIVFYLEGNVSAALLKSLGKDAKVEKYDLPKIIWQFLDTFDIKLFNKLLEKEAPELILNLMVSRLKELFWVKTGSPEYPAWRISRLKAQSNKYSIEEIKEIINELSKIDVSAKTGKSDLKTALDLLLIKKLA